jgi:hypothetical protein
MMAEPTGPDEPREDLEARLARLFRAEVDRAALDLRRRPMGVRSATAARLAPPVGLAALAVALIVAAFVLRPAADGSSRGAPSGAGEASSTGDSLAAGSPRPSVAPPSEDWSLITWSMAPTEPFGGPGNQFVTAVAAWRGGFVAIGYECCGTAHAGIVWLSPDGRHWTRSKDEGTFDETSLEFLATAADRLVIGGDQHDETVLFISSDGRDWQRAASIDRADQHIHGLAVGPAGLVAYGWQIPTRAPVTWWSTDGLAWEQRPVHFEGGRNGVHVSGTPLGYLATGARTWWSVDGARWEEASVEDDARLGVVAIGAQGMIAGGTTRPLEPSLGGPIIVPEYWHSTDGREWRRLQPSNGAPPGFGDALIGDDSTIVAVRATREIWTSRDGLSWRQLAVAADRTVDPDASALTNFRHVALGRDGIVATDDAPDGGGGEGADSAAWFGAATPGPLPQPLATLPLIHNDGRNDAMCIGGEGGDPGVVCIPIGYYLRNESTRDWIVRLDGAVEAVLGVPAGAVGRLTGIGPVWDTGKPVVVELLGPDCRVMQRLTPTGNLALVVIGADDQARVDSPPPPEPLPQTPFAASSMCSG